MFGFFNGHVLLPLLEKISKRDVFSKVSELKQFEALSYELQIIKQKEYLYKILIYCRDNIPYYHDLFTSLKFNPEYIKTDINYLFKLPILTKDDVRVNAEKLKPKDGRYLHPRKTGGSTGQSVFFFYDNEGLDWTAAINLYSYELVGKTVSKSDLHICADLNRPTPSLKEKIKQKIRLIALNRGELLISAFSDSYLKHNYDSLKKIKPYLLQGHPSTVYALARYIEKNNITPINLCSVFEPTGEMLTEKMVKAIEKNLKCRVTNRYGNAECGVIAHTWNGDMFNKLKVFDRAFYVEPCVSSSIIVTAFTNFGFPLLRYDTGDIATVVKEESGTYIYDIQGRIHDTFSINGEIFPTHYLMDFLDHKVGGVREFQVVLTNSHAYPQLNIVPENENDKDRIYSIIKEKWPSGIDIHFIDYESLKLQGWRMKFRHLIDLRDRSL